MAERELHDRSTTLTGPDEPRLHPGPEPEPPHRRKIQPIVPNPEIPPQRSPDITPQRTTQPEIEPGGPNDPEIFPQHSPDATPPFETPSEPDPQPPGEIPPLHDAY